MSGKGPSLNLTIYFSGLRLDFLLPRYPYTYGNWQYFHSILKGKEGASTKHIRQRPIVTSHSVIGIRANRTDSTAHLSPTDGAGSEARNLLAFKSRLYILPRLLLELQLPFECQLIRSKLEPH